MLRTAAILLLLICSHIRAATSPATAPTTAPAGPTEKLRKHLGQFTLDCLGKVTRAEAIRVGRVMPEKAGTPETVGGRVVEGKAVPVEGPVLERLVATLKSEDTYFRSDSKGTSVGVGYRLWTDAGECVEVSCCLKKGNVWIVTRNAAGKVIEQGDRRGFRDDPDSPMRAIAAKLFPDDADVQAAATRKPAKK